MKKYVLLSIITCFSLPFTSGCSFFNPSSNIEVSAPNADTTESDNAASEGETTPSSDVEDSSYADSSVNADEAETTPDIQTTVGYVLSVDENTMYADLKNTGSRLYPGEGEDRKVAFDISNGVNIATKLTSDGDEKEPYSPVAIGKVNAVSDTELSISVTEGDNIGETITFNLSVCDPISDPISVDSQVAIAYYTKQDINYAIYVGSMS